MNRLASLRFMMIAFTMVTFSLLYVGCGGSEEAMAEDEMVTDTGVTEETPAEQQPAEQQPQQEQPSEPQPTESQPTTPQPTVTEQPAEGPTREQLQNELDALKTENIQLKEELSTAQQKIQDLSAKVSDLEAANLALKKTGKPKPATVSTRPATAGKSTPEEIQAYENAVATFNNKNYDQTISEMQALLNSGVKDDYADNCHYWIGLSYFQKKEYESAINHLSQVMNYRFSEKKDDAQLIIAQAYERMGNKERAMAEYKKLVEMYPTSEYVGRAKAKLR
ncbi:MAG: tetratricopeptide repeat protein [Bacteroidota bacterium]